MKCFVIMPFGNPNKAPEQFRKLDKIYSQWIKPTVESINLPDNSSETITCHRADKELRPGEIIVDIIENLVTSDIVIADLSGKNPNVFYELGVRHSVSNDTILISENIDDIPFDLRGLRTIVYNYDPEGMLALKDSLRKFICEILSNPEKLDNPVRRFLYNQEVDKLVRQSTPPGYDLLKDMYSEISTLKEELNKNTKEVSHIIKLVTSSKTVKQSKKDINLEPFEGIWKDKMDMLGSTFCVRVINGNLLVPYSYYGDSELTGHYYNCKVIGNTLFGRFEWFGSAEVSGYGFLEVISNNKLEGGWWYSEDVPPAILADITRISDSIPRMNSMILVRETGTKQYPSWAEDYFQRMS